MMLVWAYVAVGFFAACRATSWKAWKTSDHYGQSCPDTGDWMLGFLFGLLCGCLWPPAIIVWAIRAVIGTGKPGSVLTRTLFRPPAYKRREMERDRLAAAHRERRAIPAKMGFEVGHEKAPGDRRA